MSDLEKRKQSAVARRLAVNVNDTVSLVISSLNNDLQSFKTLTNTNVSSINSQLNVINLGLSKVTNTLNAQFDISDPNSWEFRLQNLEATFSPVSIIGTTNEVTVDVLAVNSYQIGLPDDVILETLEADGISVKSLGKLKLFNLTNSVNVAHSCPSGLANNHEYIWPTAMGLAKESLMIQSVVSRVAQLVWYSPVLVDQVNTFTFKQSFDAGLDVTGSIDGPGSGSLTISNGAGNVVITSPITTIGNGAIDFTIDAASGTVDGSAFEWQTGDLVTSTLVTTGNITLQNAERIQNTTNGRVDIAPAPSASSFGLSIDMTSKGTGARLTTVTGTLGTTLSTGVLESLVEFQAPKFTLTTITLNSSVGGVLEYDGKVTYANTASGRGVMVSEQTSLLTSSRTISAATGNQNIFGTPQDVITLAANTTYLIRGYLHLTMGTTAARNITLRFTEGVTVNPPTINFNVLGTPSTSGGATRTQDSAAFTTTAGGNITASTITNNTYTAVITGMIKTVDSVTITPQIAFSANPGGTNSINMGSFISFIPYGSNTMAAVGPWS
jgi:hypothetical protein